MEVVTIYVKCPGCGGVALQTGSLRCAGCGFVWSMAGVVVTEDNALAAARAEGRQEGERAAATRAVLLCLEAERSGLLVRLLRFAQQLAAGAGLDFNAIVETDRRARQIAQDTAPADHRHDLPKVGNHIADDAGLDFDDIVEARERAQQVARDTLPR